MEEWKRQVEATGCISRLCYREEVEAALRTESFSGLSLLGLQDFPGQGTALVGMMNSHLQPKPYDFARPEAFAAFFRDTLPLALMERYTWRGGENFDAVIKLANYGKEEIRGELKLALSEDSGEEKPAFTPIEVTVPDCVCPQGTLTSLAHINRELPRIGRPAHLTLKLEIAGHANSYPVWLYPEEETPVMYGHDFYETRVLDDRALFLLESGGKVFLAPDSDKKSLPHSIKGQFSTDFWSVGTFDGQEGGMGQLIDEKHPIFRHFPTSFHTDWQWWPMASARALILPRRIKAIVTEMDSYAFLRPMAQLFECRVGKGRLLVSTFGLHSLQQYPEAKALLAAIYRYLKSEDFAPEQEMTADELRGLFCSGKAVI